MQDICQIKDLEHLKAIAAKGTFSVKVCLMGGLYTRKTVYKNLNCRNHVDNSFIKIKDDAIKNKYWQHYFDNHFIVFDGYNKE